MGFFSSIGKGARFAMRNRKTIGKGIQLGGALASHIGKNGGGASWATAGGIAGDIASVLQS